MGDGSHFMTEEGQYLVDFIYAQGGLSTFEFADEAQSDARFFCKVNLREVEHLAVFFFTKEEMEVS